MAFMQLEVDAVPALLGAGIFVACQLLSSLLLSRTRTRAREGAAKAKAQAVEGPAGAGGPEEEEPVPEPAPEPTLEHTATAGSGSSRWRLLVLGGVLLAFILTDASRRSLVQQPSSSNSGSSSVVLAPSHWVEPVVAEPKAVNASCTAPDCLDVAPRTPPPPTPAAPKAAQRPVSTEAADEAATEEVAEPSAQAADDLVTQEALEADDLADLSAADEELEQQQQQQLQLQLQVPAEAQEEEQPLAISEAPLTVKLTRQAMGDGQSDYIRSAYYGTLMVGTPAMEMTVVFDTGSGHLVLPSMYCQSETCKAHRRYRRSGSITGKDINYDGRLASPGQPRDSISVAFGTGEITGVLVEDVICVGGVDGVLPNGQAVNTSNSLVVAEGEGEGLDAGCMKLRFIAATELSEDPFREFSFDGVLGLGLEGLSQTPEFNFMEVVARSIREMGGRTPNTFGVFLADSPAEDSEIALGGWAKGHLTEELSWGPVHDPELGHWIVPIKGLRVDGDRLNFCDDGSCRAAVDTGTSLLAVPTAAFRELYELLRHPAPLAGHCQGSGPQLHIELEHFTVTLGPRDYAQLKQAKASSAPPRLTPNTGAGGSSPKTRKDYRCVPMLMTLDLPEPLGPKLFILGEPVLRKYYTVYDAHRKRIGLGRAKHRQAPSREELLLRAPELDAMAAAAEGRPVAPKRRLRSPTMFDVFRWRKALR